MKEVIKNYKKRHEEKRKEKQDIKKLTKEGKFLGIYNKYGYFPIKAYYVDIVNEKGKKSILQFIKNVPKKKIINNILYFYFMSQLCTFSWGYTSLHTNIFMNEKQYKELIEEYNEKLEENAKEIKKENYTELELFMKIMNDMHQRMKGYGDPKIDATGFLGLDLLEEDTEAVCRNMAKYVADQLNAIDSNYNARTISVNAKYNDFEFNNMEIKQVIDDNTIKVTKGNQQETYKNNILIEKVMFYPNKTITFNYKNEKLYSKVEKLEDEKITYFFKEGNITEKQIEKENERITFKYKNKELNEVIKINDKGITIKTIKDKNTNKVIEKSYNLNTYIPEEYKNLISQWNLEKNKEIKDQEEKDQLNENENKINEKMRKKKISNHAVVLLNSITDKLTIILDPTNGAIGVYKDNQIIMFNEKDKNNESLIRCVLRGGYLLNNSYFINANGLSALIEFPKQSLKSYLDTDYTIEELEEKYGVKAQNKALENVLNKENHNNEEKPYKETLKVEDLKNIENTILYKPYERTLKFHGEDIQIK